VTAEFCTAVPFGVTPSAVVVAWAGAAVTV
jgi:hypothetical protein